MGCLKSAINGTAASSDAAYVIGIRARVQKWSKVRGQVPQSATNVLSLHSARRCSSRTTPQFYQRPRQHPPWSGPFQFGPIPHIWVGAAQMILRTIGSVEQRTLQARGMMILTCALFLQQDHVALLPMPHRALQLPAATTSTSVIKQSAR
jgi:hypothetical protein